MPQDDVLLFNIVLATARVHVRDPHASERRRRLRQLRWIRAASSSLSTAVVMSGEAMGEGNGGGGAVVGFIFKVAGYLWWVSFVWVVTGCARHNFGQVEGDGGSSNSSSISSISDGTGGGSECALRPLQEALDRLTKALLHEERRCRYVSREVRKEGCRRPCVISYIYMGP